MEGLIVNVIHELRHGDLPEYSVKGNHGPIRGLGVWESGPW